MDDIISEYNALSLRQIQEKFTGLRPPEPGSMQGIQRGIFVGPGWLIPLWPPLLAISGLGGWWGKEIQADDTAINLVKRQGRFERRFPMYLVEQESHLDGKTGRVFRYQPDNPFPWSLIVDELRRIDERHILGMTLAEVGPLRRLGFPFILQQRDGLDE